MEPYLISAIIALGGAVSILWRRSDSSLKWLRESYDDIVKRVRKLEDDRIISEKAHGHEIKVLAMEMLEARKHDRAITKELIQSIRNMPCKSELVPDRIDPPTEPIIRNKTKDDKCACS